MLQHDYGVDLDQIDWYTWTPRARMELELPKRYKVTQLRPDQKPDQMLFNGELDNLGSGRNALFPVAIGSSITGRSISTTWVRRDAWMKESPRARGILGFTRAITVFACSAPALVHSTPTP